MNSRLHRAAFAILAILLASSAAADGAHAQRFAAAHARLDDAPDMLAAIRAAQADGSADEKGWAANALSTCTFITGASTPDGLSPAGVEDWHAAKAEAQQRCAGVTAMKRADYEALGDELRAAGIASTSELGHLRWIGATPDGLGFRPATNDELKTLAAALRDDDPVVAYTAANVMSGLIEQVAGRAGNLAFVAVAAPPSLVARQGRLDALFECLIDGWCEHTHGDTLVQAWRTPKDARQARLQRAYADALARGAALEDVLKIR